MPAYRFYIDAPLEVNQTYPIAKNEIAHIRVMRLMEGDELELVNGRGIVAKGMLLKNHEVRVLSIHQEDKTKKIILCQALPRENRLDLIVEKGTELGMTHLWLFRGERSEKKLLSPSREKRLKTIAISSLKQCGRLHLPQIELKPPLKEWETLDYPAYFGSLEKENLRFTPQKGDLLFFIGPESGFTKGEEEKLLELGAQGVSLGPNILRTDTAAIVALSITQSIL
ncbi:MAG: Ribosomal RNA small subunit methyltransferase E [Chlamydiales bacterium]|nr:Ribosomal RNA small subunit methyltransferase E [Chlamydiales bacterium]MCH9619140.1 Ribosomal RNA small subunit methyltransferase E [Chlamydiales bacterium]MCH9622402.1 Ribosomal RNA small subunit methyltransferase E [Chlamydiales bacterium]